MSKRREFIRAGGREFAVGSRGLNVEPRAYIDDMPVRGRWLHGFGFWVEPVEDQFPYMLMTDVDLLTRAKMPESLDGLRIRQSLEGGDYDTAWVKMSRWVRKKPHIRPGSTVGMAMVAYEPPSKQSSQDSDLSTHKYLRGYLEIDINREGDLWCVEVKAHHVEGQDDQSVPDFHALFYSDLEVN